MPQAPANSYLEISQNLLRTEQNSHGNAFDIRYYIVFLIRYRWLIIIAFSIAMIAGILLAVILPRQYQAKTLIQVEPQQVPDNYVHSIVSVDNDSRINNLVEMIKSRTNLMHIIEEFKLFSGSKFDNMFQEDKIRILRERTSVEQIFNKKTRQPTNMFTISFKGEDPDKVRHIVNTMAALVIDQNIIAR
jgi:uncharacterized protein involved in exopolysaccharide biosynthesis